MRTRNVVREDLRKTVSKCKNTQSIETILKIAEIYRKVYDDATFKEVSELQWEQMQVINEIMDSVNVAKIRSVKWFLRGLGKYPP